MRLSEVRINVVEAARPLDSVLAFCSCVLEGELGCLVIHDMRLVNTRSGLFLAMPDRRVKVPCRHCRRKNVLRVPFCNWCGGHRPQDEVEAEQVDDLDRPRVGRGGWVDIVHPIDQRARQALQDAVFTRYLEAVEERHRGLYRASGVAAGTQTGGANG